MNYTNWKKEKDKVSENEYFSVSEWCNDSGQYTIEERGKYFQVVKIPEPTTDEKKAIKRNERDRYLNDIQWRVERYDSQVKLGITPNDSEEVYMSILAYQQYLRDVPQQPEFPNIEIQDFKKWGDQHGL